MQPQPTAADILRLLRQLPPRQRLSVIAQALPEAERELDRRSGPLKSLYGALKELGPAPSAEDIDAARRDVWADFPRDDL